MPYDMHKGKITVLKRTLNQDLAQEYLETEGNFGACEQFSDGQEFVLETPFGMPEGFCPWAWADIRGDIMTIMAGGDLPWIKQRGTAITGCTDWFRPVIFKVERTDNPS
jgi:uncharacterized repeat protein (TIGR04076 family)